MPLWARLRRGGENDGAGRRSHGREADGRPGSAQRNAAPDFARQTQKVGPMTAARFRGVKCDRTGARAGAGTEAACGKRGKSPAFAGPITESADGVTFLVLRK